MTFGFNQKADIYAQNVVVGRNGSSFDLCTHEDCKRVTIPVLGKFNVENVLAAAAIAYSLGLSIEDMAKALRTLPMVPGRMEKVETLKGVDIIVDYAHKPDALEKVGDVILNNGDFSIIFLQPYDKLKKAREILKRKNYYKNWSIDYYQDVVNH